MEAENYSCDGYGLTTAEDEIALIVAFGELTENAAVGAATSASWLFLHSPAAADVFSLSGTRVKTHI